MRLQRQRQRRPLIRRHRHSTTGSRREWRGAAPVAIVGATVHTLEGPAIPDGVVVFENGRITAVGGADTPVPATVERVDARGKHLWPGLIHANAVLGLSEIDSVPGSVDIAETGEINADVDVSQAVNAAEHAFSGGPFRRHQPCGAGAWWRPRERHHDAGAHRRLDLGGDERGAPALARHPLARADRRRSTRSSSGRRRR